MTNPIERARHCLEGENKRLRAALQDIRNKVHAHNRGGELSYGLRETVRGICDAALNSKEKEYAADNDKNSR